MSDKEFDNTNRFVLFPNQNMRHGKRDPDLRGRINIDGDDYWFDGWTKYEEDSDEVKLISGKIGDRIEPREKPAPKKTGTRRSNEESNKSRRR